MAYTAEPARHDWLLIVGDTWQPCTLVIKDADGTPYDLTGSTGQVQLRSEPGGSVLLDLDIVLTDAEAGALTWIATAEQTEALQPQRARYSLRIVFGDDSIRTILEGQVFIRRSIVG